jgi:putative PEP-CTERM system TPR-repeat lipoprotein
VKKRRLLSRIFVPLIVLSLSWACSEANPEVAKREYLESGNRYFKQKKYNESIVEYRNAIQQDPKFGEARFQLAEAYQAINDLPNALREYARAADLLPNDTRAQLKAGDFLLLAGRYEDAKARAERVVKSDPKNIDAHILMGNAMAGLKDLETAVKQLQEAINLDPKQSKTYINLGVLHLARNKRDDAEAAFRKALEMEPQSVPAHLSLANYLWATGRAAEADLLLQRAVQLDPGDLLANRALAVFYLVSNRAPEAEKYLKTIAERSNQSAARIALADYYLATQRMDEAVKVLEAVVTEKGAFNEAKTRLAAAEYASGDPAGAHKNLDEILAREPDNADVLAIKGRVLLAENRVDEALVRAQAAVAANPRSPQAQYTLGLALVARNDVAGGIAAFNEVLKLSPSAVPAQLQLARLHLMRGGTQASVQFAEQAIKAQPDNALSHLLLARALMARREFARAEAELTALRQKYPKWPAVHAQIGTLDLMKNNPGAARKGYELALQEEPNLVEALAGLVALDVSEKKMDNARARVEARLAKTPADHEVLLLAARTYAASGDLAKTEQTLRKAIEANPTQPQPYSMLGQLYVKQQKLDDARREYEALAKYQPKSVTARTMVAMILHAQAKPGDAQKEYERTLQIDPRAAVAANNLAWIYAESGDKLDAALELAQTAKSQLPDQPEVNDTLGWIYLKKNLAQLAIPVLREAVEKDPKNPTYLYHLALAYERMGQRDDARQAVEQALKLKPDFAEEAKKLLFRVSGRT